ncbi:MAG: PTS fructose transporter subunit IIB [Liquorilactobacillus ghanensis]|uniref:PTS fructose transporter subunit IIB n=1 Tax=Liquorilactobacillus ghanensis TaxID=399370 RepID=UPI0039E9E836
MKIVGVAACTSGIAHTYIAKEKIIQAAKKLGYEIHIETQGTIGTEDELTTQEISDADFVLLAVDIKISGKERFEEKKVFEVPTNIVIKSPTKLLETLAKKVGKGDE